MMPIESLTIYGSVFKNTFCHSNLPSPAYYLLYRMTMSNVNVIACSWNGCVPLLRKLEGNDLSLDLTRRQFLLSCASFHHF